MCEGREPWGRAGVGMVVARATVIRGCIGAMLHMKHVHQTTEEVRR